MANLRSVFEQLNDVSLRAVIQEEAYRDIKQTIKETKTYNPFAHPVGVADSLEKLGIETNPFAVKAHTHAAAKTIELDMYKIVSFYLPKENPTTFLFMKKSKLQYFRRGPQHKDIFLNAHIEPKDVARYDSDTLFNRDVTPEIQTSSAFMGDTLHFLPLKAVENIFSKSPKLQTLYATIVLPPEAQHRLHSLHPSIYELEFHKDHFIYKPGGHAGAAYIHKYDQLQWLKIGRFKWADSKGITHTVTSQILETKGANHLFIFQRGRYLTPELRCFSTETKYVTMPPIFLPKEFNARLPIKKTTAQQLFLYIKSVKNVTERDIWAKMRQLLKTSELQDYNPKEVTLLVNYFLLISRLRSETCFDNVLSGGIFKKIFKPFITWWQIQKNKILGSEEFEQLMEALEWVDVSLTYRVQDYDGRSWVSRLEASRGYEWFEDEQRKPKGPELGDAGKKDDPHQESYEKYLKALSILQKTEEPKQEATNEVEEAKVQMELERPKEEQPPPRPEPQSEASTSGPAKETQKLKRKEIPPSKILCPCGLCIEVKRAEFPELPVLSHPDHLKGRKAWFFSRDGKPYSYSGGSHASRGWPNWLEEILATIELKEPLPFFNQCLVQEFKLKSAIPFHKDDEPCYPKGHQVLTINHSGEALTQICCQAGQGQISLSFGDYYLSPPGFQESHKHAVSNCTGGRISLTFRCTTKQNVFEEDGSVQPLDSLPWKHWLGKLNNLGFQGRQLQYDQNGALISPIEQIKNLPKCKPEGVSEVVFKTLENLARAPTPYSPNPIRARAYTSDVKNCRIGALLRHQGKEWGCRFDALVESGRRELAISVIHGAGGSGKSQGLQTMIKDNPELEITVVLPTNELRLDWLKKLPKISQDRFKTFEKALLAPPTPVVIFDDYGKLPAGYVEAFCLYFSTVQLVILTGDCKQSTHHESNENATTSSIEPLVAEASELCRYYINATHRNKRDLANKLGVYSERSGLTEITQGTTPIPGLHLLVPSLYKKQAFTEMGHKVSTYAGCQGLTAPKIQILLTEETTLCSQEVLYTALSRAVHSIHFVNASPNNASFWKKLECTPYLKAFLSTLREDTATAVKEPSAEPSPVEPPRTHIAKEDAMPEYENIIEEMPEKHEREIFSEKHGHSNCVQTDDPFVQMFSHQQAKDDTLLWATIEARLVVSNPKANWQEYLEKRPVGDVLFESYKRAMHLPKMPIPFEEALWESSLQEVQRTYLAKPENMIKNGMARQSPDYDPNVISLFLKSQWVKKMEKLGALKIKPGQTIASFHQATVMLFGTMARYMRRMREVFQPAHIRINCEMTPEDLSSWAAGEGGHWKFKGPSLANDFTAFDQSQDGAMLQFEILKARHHSIPEDVLDAYLTIKTNSKIFLGVLAIMRLTGEGPTFDANTECNIAFTHTKFQIPEGMAQLYAGDDSAIDGLPAVRSSFKMVEQKLTLRSKPQIALQQKGDWAEFCGFRITPKGLIKDPKKLHASWTLEKKKGNVKNVLRSYELDLALAYQHKDSLHEILSEEELKYHYETVRSIVKSGGGGVLNTYISKDESLY
uniref:RNA replication protein n=1 Tax=Papaya mosaic potexvirus TaxID=12181 RepID=A0A6B9KXI0_PMV|nr:replicase [Papaya mosaic virus]